MSNNKILVVSELIPPDYSGAGISAKAIARYLDEKGRLFALLTRTSKKEINAKEPLDEQKIVRLKFAIQKLRRTKHPILKPLYQSTLSVYFFFFALYFVTKNRKKFDMAFFVSYRWLTFFIAVFCKLYKKKFIIETTLIGQDDPMGFMGGKYIFFRKRMKAFLFKNAYKVTNISSGLAEKCIDFGLPREKVFVIPRGVKADNDPMLTTEKKMFLRKKLNIPEKSYPVILFVGALTLRKGIDIVYETYLMLKQYYPNMMLLLAGIDDQHEYMDKINFECQKQKGNNIKKLGVTQNVDDYMKVSDVLFFPSRNEGFGRVFIEAMAVGLPVVCKKIHGVTDDIFPGHKKEAIVLDSDHPEAFYNAIVGFLADSSLQSTLKKNARDQFNKRFSQDIIFAKYDELFS